MQGWSGNELTDFKDYFKPYRFGLPNSQKGRLFNYVIIAVLLFLSHFNTFTISSTTASKTTLSANLHEYEDMFVFWAVLSLIDAGINQVKKPKTELGITSLQCPHCKTDMDPHVVRCQKCGGKFEMGQDT
jgi:hypothetical protein